MEVAKLYVKKKGWWPTTDVTAIPKPPLYRFSIDRLLLTSSTILLRSSGPFTCKLVLRVSNGVKMSRKPPAMTDPPRDLTGKGKAMDCDISLERTSQNLVEGTWMRANRTPE